jgi:hypothetical protein
MDATFQIRKEYYTSIFLYFKIVRLLCEKTWIAIATGYVLDEQGIRVLVPEGSRIFSFPRRPDWLWGPPNLLFNGYGGSFPGDKVAGSRS